MFNAYEHRVKCGVHMSRACTALVGPPWVKFRLKKIKYKIVHTELIAPWTSFIDMTYMVLCSE